MSSNCYQPNPKFYVAVDCIIFGYSNGHLKVLLQQRSFEPHAGEWSLVGGFVQENEDVAEAAKRVLRELTGIKNIYMTQVGTFGAVHRDSGDRVVSIAYSALVDINKIDEQRNHEHAAYWEDLSHLPLLLFDHREMIEHAYQILRATIGRKPVGFHLLPQKFTLTQLQQLYEAILDTPLDKRNFRKRINDIPCIERTDEVDHTTSKRGAALYKFNEQAYLHYQNFRL